MAQMPIHRVESDLTSDSMYLHFTDKPISHSVEMSPDIIIDLDEDNGVVGIDVQHMSILFNEAVTPTRQSRVGRGPAPSPAVRLQLVSV